MLCYVVKVEWFWNGRPLKTGSRFRTFCDFGFVILEISPVYPEDSGEYSCRAFNDYGQAVTTASMKVQGNSNMILLESWAIHSRFLSTLKGRKLQRCVALW
jgi:hypothetical protein